MNRVVQVPLTGIFLLCMNLTVRHGCVCPAGDASMAGERGINLSGGQRQRVCLARAAYHDAQLVLLDNPLSAVDQHTSKHIFDKCIKGLLLEKAVVLVAHQLELLPQVNKHWGVNTNHSGHPAPNKGLPGAVSKFAMQTGCCAPRLMCQVNPID